MPDSLRDFYNSIELDRIHRFIDEHEPESLTLEFKTMPERKGMMGLLAKCCSAFANSVGGIVIWGVDCRKTNGVDCAKKIVPIDDVEKRLSDIREFTPMSTSPPTGDAEHKLILTEGKNGLIVSHVPESSGTPRMAKFGEDRFYRRSGDRNRKMEHFEIADMFGRRARPELSLSYEVVGGGRASGGTQSYENAIIVVGIRNSGRSIARYPSLRLSVSPLLYQLSEYGLDGNGNTGLPRVRSWNGSLRTEDFGGGAGDVIHAGSELQVTRVKARLGRDLTHMPSLKIEYAIFAESIEPVQGEVSVPGRKIVEVIRKAYADGIPNVVSAEED